MRIRDTAAPSDSSTTIDWASGQSGDWSDAGDWSPHTVPGAADTVVISARSHPNGYTVSISTPESAGVLRINSPEADVDDRSTLTLGGLMKLDNGAFVLDAGGTVSGGRIVVNPDGFFAADGGTLSGVHFEGTLNVDELTIDGGTTFSGDDGSGSASIVDDANLGIKVLGEDLLNHATISLGGTLTSAAHGSQAGYLVLGGDTTIDQVAGSSGLPQAIIAAPGASIVNNGTINAGVAGGVLLLDANLKNDNQINLGQGDTIDLVGSASGARASSLIASIDNGGGTIGLGATITGGRLDGSFQAMGGTLSDVRFQGTLILNSPVLDEKAFFGLDITGPTSFAGLDGSGAATIDISNLSTLTFDTSDTMNNAVVRVVTGVIATAGTVGDAVTLTLGRHAVVDVAAGGYADFAPSNQDAADETINDGSINVTVSTASTLTLTVGNFVNDGTINLGAGNVIELAASNPYAGTFTGAQAMALISSVHNAGGGFELFGNVDGGTLNTALDQSNDSVTLDGVTFEGSMNIGTAAEGEQGVVDFEDGTTFAGADCSGKATISLTGNGILGSVGSATLNNAIVDIGSSNAFGPSLDDNDTSAGAGTFTIGASTTITQDGATASAFSDLDTGSGFVNDGVIDLTYAGGRFYSLSMEFANAGAIDVANGSTLLFEVAAGSAYGAGDVSNTGSIEIDSSSSVSLASAIFSNDAGGVINLDASSGDTATFGGDRGSLLDNDGGTLRADGSGTATVDAYFNNGGLISASTGTLQFLGNLSNSGTISETGGSLVVNGALGPDGTGSGLVNLGAGALVSMLGGASASETFDFLATTGDLVVKSPLSFLGQIAGFGGSDVIELLKTAQNGYGFSNGVLTITNGSSTVASLTFLGSYKQQDFAVVTNPHGDTFITYS